MDTDLKPTVVETSTPFAWTGDLMIGDSLRDPSQQHEFRRRTMTASAENGRMRDVTLFPPLALAFHGAQIVEETRYCVHDEEADFATKRLAEPHLRFHGDRAFMGFNRPCVNHFHILTQIVPAIASYQADAGFRGGALLLPNVTQEDSQALTTRALELAGIDTFDVIRLGPEPVDIRDLTFSSYLTGCDGPSLFCRRVFDRMIERAERPIKSRKARSIYICRTDSTMRPMLNEDALVQRLARYGVEPMVLSTLRLDEEIALFQDAELVIGPHGAGLANIVFSRPGTVMYELLPSHYINPSISHLAQMRGMHYWCDLHRSEDMAGTRRHQVRWSVDLDAVEQRLTEIFVRYDLVR